MFRYLRNIEGNSNPVMLFVKATSNEGTMPKAGDAVAISAGLAVKASASNGKILGIAKEDVNEDGEVLVIVDPQATYRVPFTGTTKTQLTEADLFSSFDLVDAGTLDLDNKTNEQFIVLEFDNIANTAVVKINKPML